MRIKGKISSWKSPFFHNHTIDQQEQNSTEISKRYLSDIRQNIIKYLVRKYANSICQDIYARFSSNSCEIFTVFSTFDVYLLPTLYSPTFSVYGIEKISCLGKRLFLNATNCSLLGQWNDIKFEIIKMKKKTATLRNQLQLNKIKFKKTLTEWTGEHIFKELLLFQWLHNLKNQVSLNLL